MKITSINARMDSSGRHNDRNYDINASPHIDKTRVADNRYYTYNGDNEKTFRQIELEYYQEEFGDYVAERNRRCVETGHKARRIKIKDYHSGKNTRPEDKILQIGNKRKHASAEALWECALEYRDRFEELYGNHCKILDMALHMDEATPHVHVRRVWIADTENGTKQISQTKALEQLGITAPDTTIPENRWNNAKMTFTETDRALFREICIEHGLAVDKEEPKKRKHLSTEEFKLNELGKDIKDLERTREEISADIKNMSEEIEEVKQAIEEFSEFFNDNAEVFNLSRKKLEEIEKKNMKEKLKAYLDLYGNALRKSMKDSSTFTKLSGKAELQVDIHRMQAFIRENGLEEKYKEYEKKSISKAEERASQDSQEPVRDKKVFF